MGTEIVFEQCNPGACRTYFIGDPETREALLVDPILSSSPDYLERLRRGGWSLRYVLDTHTHADHVSGGRFLSERTGAEYVMHKRAGTRWVGRRLTDGATVELAGIRIEAIETPGHTKDSVTLLLPGRLLTGDWLFIGGAGRCDLPGGDAGEHWDSLNRVIPSLDENVIVYPGHDYRNLHQSPLREEKRSNVNLEPRGREEYIRWLSAMREPTPEWMIATIRANNEGVIDPRVSFMPEGETSACMRKPASAPTGIPEVSVDEAKSMAEASRERLLLDVRQPEEYQGPMGHVPGAILIPLPELHARLREIEGYRDKLVIAICRTGARSASAAEILVSAGFRNVVNMAGGTLAWRSRGFPIES
jgi:glyoxylase-like metal-dependent hydrolase (beta-lactamase superfamily II)/rhodanese-related sulfurtransferase